MDDGLALAQSVVDEALAAGATQADATLTVGRRFSAEARGAVIEKLEQSTARALALRVFVNGGKASLGTSDLTAAGLREFARRTVDAARFVGYDPNVGLPDASGDLSDGADLAMYDEDVPERSADAKLEDALALEARIRAFDKRIVNSGGARVSDNVTTIFFANSNKLRGSYRSSSASRGVAPIAQDGEQKRVASYASAARGYGPLESVESVATTAAQRAVEMCGAKKPKTMRCPVIFERDVAALVLGDVFSALTAANVAAGNSFLIDRIGQRIGSDLVYVVDDGRLRGGLGTSPFDAEGVPTGCTQIFRAGVLETFLYDTYYGRKLGAASTGNAAHGGIGPNNFYLLAGERSLEDLIAATPRGVLVLDTIGFSTDYATGTYSRGARGIMIENGERAYPIDEFTIAGNLLEMLAAVDFVANDLRFDSAIVGPSFRVAEMTVSGS